jgi:hypothetical protein
MFAPLVIMPVKILAREFARLETRLLSLKNYWKTVYLCMEWTNTSAGVKHDWIIMFRTHIKKRKQAI